MYATILKKRSVATSVSSRLSSSPFIDHNLKINISSSVSDRIVISLMKSGIGQLMEKDASVICKAFIVCYHRLRIEGPG